MSAVTLWLCHEPQSWAVVRCVAGEEVIVSLFLQVEMVATEDQRRFLTAAIAETAGV